MARLKDNIEHLKHETDEADSDDKQRAELVNRQYEADKEKLHKIRLLLVGITLLPLIITVATLLFFWKKKSYNRVQEFPCCPTPLFWSCCLNAGNKGLGMKGEAVL